MTLFANELNALVNGAAKVTGGDQYAVPWYLVIGEPRTGKSTVIRSMNLTWQGDGQVPVGGGQYCTYWASKEAVLIEAGERLCGPSANLDFLRALAEEMKSVRVREPLDGIILVLSATDIAELQEESLEKHAKQLRTYLVEVMKVIGAEIPVYVVINRYDTLWGFAEVFVWNGDRAKEEAWGFVVPPDTQSQAAMPKIQEGIEGLGARIEALCLTRLSSEDNPEQRIRAFQHISEAKQFLEKLNEVMKVVAFSSRYERAPWIRALIVGAAVPGIGDRIRACIQRFNNMGLLQNPYDPARATRPGGLPVHSFMRTTVLPEKDLVPLKIRWRDDLPTFVGLIFGTVLIVAGTVVYFVLVR